MRIRTVPAATLPILAVRKLAGEYKSLPVLSPDLSTWIFIPHNMPEEELDSTADAAWKVYVGVPEIFDRLREDADIGGAVNVLTIDEDGRVIDTYPLNPRLDLVEHSPTGFAWGYDGSGPAQLALAMLCDSQPDEALAVRAYMAFKSDVVAQLRPGFWVVHSDDISKWFKEPKPWAQ